MAKGNPNDKTKLLNFVAKVYDPKAKAWKPVYELPDATHQVHGGVYLSDAVNETSDAATGVVAATPKAVKTVNDNANNKLDKTNGAAQNVASAVTFNGLVTGNSGFKGNLTGNVTGNASTATKLQTARTISVQAGAKGTAGSTTFDGSGNASIVIPTIDATAVTGVLPLSTIPAAATERIITVANQAARFALTASQVQLGDTVYQSDTKIMYMVVDQNKLNQAAGYQEYQAGMAAKLGAATVGGTAKGMYLNAGVATAMSATVGAANRPVYMNGGTITVGSYELNKSVPANALFTDTTYSVFTPATASAAGSTGLVSQPPAGANTKFLRGDGTWQVAGEVTGVKGNVESTYRKGNVNITAANVGALSTSGGTLSGSVTPNVDNTLSLGSSTMKWANVYATTFNGNATSATTATTATTANRLNKSIQLAGDITSNAVSLNADGTATITGNIAAGVVGTTELANTSVTTAKVADSNITAAKLADGSVTTTKIVDGNVTLAKLASNSVNASKIVDGSIGTAEMANGAITNAKLSSDVGTVYVGASEPTEANVKLWIKI